MEGRGCIDLESVPFGEEVQGLQRGRVQREAADLHGNHRRGGVLQSELLHLRGKTEIGPDLP